MVGSGDSGRMRLDEKSCLVWMRKGLRLNEKREGRMRRGVKVGWEGRMKREVKVGWEETSKNEKRVKVWWEE